MNFLFYKSENFSVRRPGNVRFNWSSRCWWWSACWHWAEGERDRASVLASWIYFMNLLRGSSSWFLTVDRLNGLLELIAFMVLPNRSSQRIVLIAPIELIAVKRSHLAACSDTLSAISIDHRIFQEGKLSFNDDPLRSLSIINEQAIYFRNWLIH